MAVGRQVVVGLNVKNSDGNSVVVGTKDEGVNVLDGAAVGVPVGRSVAGPTGGPTSISS